MAAFGGPRVVAAGHGLAETGDYSYAPRPATSRDQLMQLVTSGGWLHEVTTIALVSWTFFPQYLWRAYLCTGDGPEKI